ncbi:hypothetical protein SAMN05444858_101633 [Micromonospora avicenniae]|uniref:Uncharacterized protein n=1 Tax=Micromonospora avicenniae TaxID=1198245 RepID=A0A1N6R896_9ACTN|nr:hypothetical protein SAMN05444858_101633 [Micromonospora avicenniae]
MPTNSSPPALALQLGTPWAGPPPRTVPPVGWAGRRRGRAKIRTSGSKSVPEIHQGPRMPGKGGGSRAGRAAADTDPWASQTGPPTGE